MTVRTSPFDAVADLYDAMRPGYPEALFDALVQAAHLAAEARLLEIGPGPGKATLPLAQRGYHITAVELGGNMARTARDNLRDYPNAQIINASFEEADLPVAEFDLVYAATAFHWIAPEVRFARSHALLKPAGHVAIIRRHAVSDEQGDLFIKASQPIYRQHRETGSSSRAKDPVRRSDLSPQPIDETLFQLSHFATFPVVARYASQEYVSLLSTHSSIILLPADTRASLLGEIRRLIDERFNGQITLHSAVSLLVARKR
jgi:SAM-dependent methyltransferase